VGSLVAADTGGTFTDLAAFDRETGAVVYSKSLTTYDDLVTGVMDCITKADVDLRRAELVKFGTTLVINTFVQRNGSKTALIATEGHRDILEIRRGNRTVPFDRHFEREPVLVERDLRFEARERMAADGTVVEPLDEARLRELAQTLKSAGIESIAVSFLNSYINSAHEERAVMLLRELLPEHYIIAGSELTREWYEYERTSTAAANAYVGPKLRDYVRRLDDRMRASGLERAFLLMASNGGVISVERAQHQPGILVESGPVGGCIGAAVYARELGLPNVIAFDMGGTTAKCALIENGQFEVKSPYYVGGIERGFPVRHAVLDIVEVGAGGGSIAWLDPQDRLRVGPQSAGSTPGPAAYGRGGTAATITDANLVLGRVGATSFLGGEMPLDLAAATEAVRRVGEPLGFTGSDGLDEVAHGILALGTITMASAIKEITIERGLDPRQFVLFAFGGGGPLHASTLAKELQIPEVIVPPEPGIFSALGMLLADARIDETQTFLRPLESAMLPDMETAFGAMAQAIAEALTREVGASGVRVGRSLHLRFKGQRHFVRTAIADDADIPAIRKTFEDIYRQRYGYVEPNSPIEIVSLSVTALADLNGPALDQLRPPAGSAGTNAPATRAVYFQEAGKRVDTPVYKRANLPPGFASVGPAVIEEYGTSTVVAPGDPFSIGRLGEIRIQCA
jgi:N-methylhydantoinase A